MCRRVPQQLAIEKHKIAEHYAMRLVSDRHSRYHVGIQELGVCILNPASDENFVTANVSHEMLFY